MHFTKILSFSILEKIFNGFLSYVGMAAIRVCWSRTFDQLSDPIVEEAKYVIL